MIYKHEDFERLIGETIDNIRRLSKLKGGEYAGDTDRLANFRRNAANLDLTMEQVWSVYAGKHWDAIQQWVRDVAKGVQRERGEPILGRFDDLIVYCILGKAMAQERSDKGNDDCLFPNYPLTFKAAHVDETPEQAKERLQKIIAKQIDQGKYNALR